MPERALGAERLVDRKPIWEPDDGEAEASSAQRDPSNKAMWFQACTSILPI